MRKNLDLEIREDKIVLWRKITRALKEIYEPTNIVDKTVINIMDKTINPNKDTNDCLSTPNPKGQGEALPPPSEETSNTCCCGHKCPGHGCRCSDQRLPP